MNFVGGVKIDSTIPPSLTNLSSLTFLDLSNCNLRGELPANILNMPQLQWIYVGGNKDLHANFPLSNWSTSLRRIDLSDVNFSSELPQSSPVQYQPTQLEELYLSGCSFYGQIPNWMWNMTIRNDTYNKFEGEIPNNIGKLVALHGLNLSHNQFIGPIPPSLCNLTSLNCLDLSSNKFTGQIPQELSSLSSLGTFNVSNNQLEGPIPNDNHLKTFGVDSYKGNPGLCGFPLPECGEHNRPGTQPWKKENEEADEDMMSEWKVAIMGCGFGTFVSFAWGCYMLSIGRPLWLVKLVLVIVDIIERRLFDRRRRRPTRPRN